MRLTIAALGLLCLSAPAARAEDPKCGAHQHVAVEKDEDEGGTVKRCVCDDGWSGGGPGTPCRKAKPGKPTGKGAK
jgi:hypothetical protein